MLRGVPWEWSLGRTRRGFPWLVRVFVEKAVDVQIAVDMVTMAAANEFETAYLLSADGDFTPAVEAVRGFGKRVYAVSPAACVKLAEVANSYIRLKREWLLEKGIFPRPTGRRSPRNDSA
jgi:uncharacterized LabA/DUF88 family protein